MLENLKKEVCEANRSLVKHGLVQFTWGNVSGIDREKGLIVIKPSGVPFDELTPDNMVVADLSGKSSSEYKPSSDLPTHLELYKAFAGIGGVVHTHSKFATAYAQAGADILPYGTTHADFAFGAIPCTWEMAKKEVEQDYEKNTGCIIVDYFKQNEIDCNSVPAALVCSHGPFVWGSSPAAAVENAAILELVAEMAFYTERISNKNYAPKIPDYLLEKHYNRKHGSSAYYGQKGK